MFYEWYHGWSADGQTPEFNCHFEWFKTAKGCFLFVSPKRLKKKGGKDKSCKLSHEAFFQDFCVNWSIILLDKLCHHNTTLLPRVSPCVCLLSVRPWLETVIFNHNQIQNLCVPPYSHACICIVSKNRVWRRKRRTTESKHKPQSTKKPKDPTAFFIIWLLHATHILTQECVYAYME